MTVNRRMNSEMEETFDLFNLSALLRGDNPNLVEDHMFMEMLPPLQCFKVDKYSLIRQYLTRQKLGPQEFTNYWVELTGICSKK